MQHARKSDKNLTLRLSGWFLFFSLHLYTISSSCFFSIPGERRQLALIAPSHTA
ncbi:uncharacterized protein K441DRAFT_665747 [Cenococcum geophilum 1.58]|uniref:uncharacterized protein n=1 Tax=Cenococcum geophilum 1.58 TaxID=794803 RepID=UPI00359029A5|nr:hypothetical protein K441DRAFT_665747 [Cenococcum geophilum 1.58]